MAIYVQIGLVSVRQPKLTLQLSIPQSPEFMHLLPPSVRHRYTSPHITVQSSELSTAWWQLLGDGL